MAEDKTVTHNTRIPFMRYSRTGEAEGPVMPTSWDENTGLFGEQYSLGTVYCGGYNGNFKEKFSKSDQGLVTGPMAVDLTQRVIVRGFQRRGVAGPSPKSTSYHSYDDAGRWGTADVAEPSIAEEDSLLVSVRNSCSAGLVAKWTKERKVLTAAFLAEAGKSAELCIDYVTQVSSLFKGAYKRVERRLRRTVVQAEKRARRRAANLQPAAKYTTRQTARDVKKLIDFASQEWIKLRFGMLPLVDDLEGLALSTLRYGQKSRRKSKVRYVARGQVANSGTSPRNTAFNFTGGSYSCTRVRSVEVTIKYLTMIALDPTEFALPTALGIDKRSIAPTIWELLPWSWAADYVSNAGDVIEAYSQFSFVTASTQVTQVILNKDVSTFADASSISPPYRVLYHSCSPGTDTTTRTRITRSLTGGVPLPTLTFQNNLNPLRWSMVATVGWQQLAARRLRVLTQRLIKAG